MERSETMSKGPFDVENKVWMFLNKLTDIFLLSMLGFIFSVPIVTVGAATAGFYYGAMRIFDNTDTGVWHDFINGFKKSFRAATVVWLIQVLLTAILLMNIWVSFRMNTLISWFILGINAMIFLMLILISIFVYPITTRYNFGIKKILHDSAVITCTHLPYAFSLLAIIVVGVVASIYVRYVYLFTPSIIGYNIARVSVWIFNKYEKNDAESVENESENGEKNICVNCRE
jgi:uncharacterized membrane protein YesL